MVINIENMAINIENIDLIPKNMNIYGKEGNHFKRNTIGHLGVCQSELKYRSSIHLHIDCLLNL